MRPAEKMTQSQLATSSLESPPLHPDIHKLIDRLCRITHTTWQKHTWNSESSDHNSKLSAEVVLGVRMHPSGLRFPSNRSRRTDLALCPCVVRRSFSIMGGKMLRTLEIYEDFQCVSSHHFTQGTDTAETNPRSWWVKAEPGPQLAVLVQGYDFSHPSMELSTHSTAVSVCSGKIPQTGRHTAQLWTLVKGKV